MYLHLGSSVVVPQGDILGIFDLDNTTYSRITRDFLASAEVLGQVVTIGEDLPKSFLLCRDKAGRDTVYLSQLSSATLLKRVESGRFETF
ncbi:extracellular matrix regulator RemB [Evtepia sp.]|uniref:extracellular matrix regulator RemB n=1 Tax=Evtepia sp. TaxID=2773933 RepID=UPI003F16F375